VKTNNFYALQFATDNGSSRSLRVTDAKTGLNPSTVGMQLSRIISSGALNGPDGDVISLRKGELVSDKIETMI